MKHGSSVSELQTVYSVHVADDPFQIVFVHNIRDSGVVSVEILDSQLPKHWTCANKWGTVLSSALPSWQKSCTKQFILMR